MRVMCMNDSESKAVIVLDIMEIGFTSDLFNDNDDTAVSGLYMVSNEGLTCYISGIPLVVCTAICDFVLTEGYADLSSYGELLVK